MHPEILNSNQKEIIPFLLDLKKDFYLVGGTAIALQIGHRESIDFDYFTFKKVKNEAISKTLIKRFGSYRLLFSDSESFHVIVNDVKLTFFQYPFLIPSEMRFEGIKMPKLLELAAMKAYAIGRRSKWKDYVDLYFLLKDYFSRDQVEVRTSELFGELFSPKLFRQQLSYFQDIDYSEEVQYLPGREVSEETVKGYLTDVSLLF